MLEYFYTINVQNWNFKSIALEKISILGDIDFFKGIKAFAFGFLDLRFHYLAEMTIRFAIKDYMHFIHFRSAIVK